MHAVDGRSTHSGHNKGSPDVLPRGADRESLAWVCNGHGQLGWACPILREAALGQPRLPVSRRVLVN